MEEYKGLVKFYAHTKYQHILREYVGVNILDLYNTLVAKGIISQINYDPYERKQIEKAGFDYDEMYKALCTVDEQVGDYGKLFTFCNFQDLTNGDIFDLIMDETYDYDVKILDDENCPLETLEGKVIQPEKTYYLCDDCGEYIAEHVCHNIKEAKLWFHNANFDEELNNPDNDIVTNDSI